MAAYQYVYVMNHLTKTYPGGVEVLKDITLAFLPGAKIGVLGYNGAGKSTVLRIMAGIDTEVRGDAQLAPGASIASPRKSVSRPAMMLRTVDLPAPL